MMNQAEASIVSVVKQVAIQTGWQPALGGVAGFTGLLKYPGVYQRFFVTARAFSRCVREWIFESLGRQRGRACRGEVRVVSLNIIWRCLRPVNRMTSHAGDCLVLAFQGEAGVAMIEIGEAILTVVANLAIHTKIQDMLLDEPGVLDGVAVNTIICCH